MGGGKPDEDYLIEHMLQTLTPNTLSLEEVLKEIHKNHQIDLCLAHSKHTHIKTIEFGPERTLKINPSLFVHQEEKLWNMIKEHLDAFAWNYKEMKGVYPLACTNQIYIKEGWKLVQQPQRRMNPTLQHIVKEELKKLLDAGFIYLISENERVSPLVLVPKKNGKLSICVY